MQLALMKDESTSKTITYLPVEQLKISPFNPRRIRGADGIQKLAERINRNGYEVTRALWVYPNNGHYEVFAGGTRLEAAKMAGVESIPVVLHEGFTEDEITRLADEDNENDEYHAPVPIVDVWMDYKQLSEMGWKNKRIAQAKGTSESQVSKRLQYADFPSSVLEKFQIESLAESHAFELLSLDPLKDFFSWIDREAAMLEVIDRAVKRGGTAKHFADIVSDYNTLASRLDQYRNDLGDPWIGYLIDLLAENKVRSLAAMQSAYNVIVREKLDEARKEEEELARQQSKAEAERLRLQREAELAAQIDAILSKIHHADARQVMTDMPVGTTLLLTDPPYGMSFQSNRRVASTKADKIANDDDAAFSLLSDVLTQAYTRMADDSTILIWTGWRYECEFRQIIEQAGFKIKGSLVWNKPNHGTGDLEGSFAPKHERIIHAVKGNPKLRFRPDDVLTGSRFVGTDHPTEKPVDLLKTLIEATTDEGDTVVDPFAGVGSTILAAYESGRDFWACELNKDWHTVARDVIYKKITGSANGT